MLPRRRKAGGSTLLSALRQVDGFAFKRQADDTVVKTTYGGFLWLSLMIVLVVLVIVEVWAYVASDLKTEVELDTWNESKPTTLKFNVTFPRLECSTIAIDVRDVQGREMLDVEEFVTKHHMDPSTAERLMKEDEVGVVTPEYEHSALTEEERAHGAFEATGASLREYLDSHTLVAVAFTASWCSHCQVLKPTWDKVASDLRAYDEHVRLARVECTDPTSAALCRAYSIRAYPTILLFNRARKPIRSGPKDQLAPTGQFNGHRTVEALVEMLLYEVESVGLVGGSVGALRRPVGLQVGALQKEEAEKEQEDAVDEASHLVQLLKDSHIGLPLQFTSALSQASKLVKERRKAELRARNPANLPGLPPEEALRGEGGCDVVAALPIGRVPGSVTFRVHTEGLHIQPAAINTTHHFSRLRFGPKLPKAVAARLPVAHALSHEAMAGKTFVADAPHTAFEHYLRVLGASYHMLGRNPVQESFRYAASSRAYSVHPSPSPANPNPSPLPFQVRVDFDIAATRTVTTEHREPLYRFVTSLCAILGGALGVVNILDSIIDAGVRRKRD